MTINTIHCLNQVASFLKVSPGKLTFNSTSIPVRTVNNSTTTGFIAIILELLKHANSNVAVLNIKDKAEVKQWLEYAIVYIINNNNSQNIMQVLKELNEILSSRTFLISNKLTIADVVMYYVLYHIMINLSYLDKEKYLNLSRWFDNLQQDSCLRQKNTKIDFSTNYLTIIAPVRH